MELRLLPLLLAALLLGCPVGSALAAGVETAAEDAPEAVDEDEDQDESPKKGKRKKPDEQRHRLLPIPIFVTEPAVGKGLGVAMTVFHPVKKGAEGEARLATPESIGGYSSPRKAPPVVTAAVGAYTDSDSWLAGVAHSNNWRNDSIRYTGALAGARVNSRIYVLNLPIKFSMETAIVYQDLKFRIKDSPFMIGIAGSYMGADNRFGLGLPEDPDGFDDSLFSTDFNNIGLAGRLLYDTRDNTMNPLAGQFAELSLWRYDDAIGSDFDYWSAKLKAQSFHPLTEKITLGLRLEYNAVDGKPPFFAIPWVSLRGIPALRYQNKKAGAFEIEGRYRLRPRWEVSLFGGLGYTSDDYQAFENPDSIYNFGFGGRYNIFEAHNVWVGLDIARGPEEWNWYIQVGHPW